MKTTAKYFNKKYMDNIFSFSFLYYEKLFCHFSKSSTIQNKNYNSIQTFLWHLFEFISS